MERILEEKKGKEVETVIERPDECGRSEAEWWEREKNETRLDGETEMGRETFSFRRMLEADDDDDDDWNYPMAYTSTPLPPNSARDPDVSYPSLGHIWEVSWCSTSVLRRLGC